MYNDVFQTFPVLETERLLLRQLTENDAQALLVYSKDPELLRFTDYPPNYSEIIPQAIKMWNTEAYHPDRMLNWCIALKDNNVCIGKIYLFEPKGDDTCGRRMDIGYEISTKYRNKGYVTEAMNKVVVFCFTHMGLKRIQAQIMPENLASIRICEKSSFKREGILRNYCEYVHNSTGLRDMVIMSCIPSDIGL